MTDFKRASYILDERGNSAKGAKPVAVPVFKYAAEDAEQAARSERRLAELASKPFFEPESGQLLFKCSACHDMKWLKADVPFGHRLFGRIRLCPCSSQFALYGAKWYAPGELFHQ